MRVRSRLRSDNDLYRRGRATLIASWGEYARGSAAAKLVTSNRFAAGVFPSEPERTVYNNVLLRDGLVRAERVRAIQEIESLYAGARVDHYAAWAHESDGALRAELSGSGYKLEETTRVMGMSLDEIHPGPGGIDCEPLEWPQYVAYLSADGAPDGLLSAADPAAFHALGVRLGGKYVAAAITFDHGGDCGIFNMSTLEPYRRRGLGAALLTCHLLDAVDRGCSTASLQSTPIAEGVYVSVGFRDLGRFFEYAPEGSR